MSLKKYLCTYCRYFDPSAAITRGQPVCRAYGFKLNRAFYGPDYTAQCQHGALPDRPPETPEPEPEPEPGPERGNLYLIEYLVGPAQAPQLEFAWVNARNSIHALSKLRGLLPDFVGELECSLQRFIFKIEHCGILRTVDLRPTQERLVNLAQTRAVSPASHVVKLQRV